MESSPAAPPRRNTKLRRAFPCQTYKTAIASCSQPKRPKDHESARGRVQPSSKSQPFEPNSSRGRESAGRMALIEATGPSLLARARLKNDTLPTGRLG